MKKLKVFIGSTVTIICLLMFLQGCATVGEPFRFQGTESIVVGKTTQSDVLSRYGKPFRVGYDNGNVKWTYGYYHYKLFGDSETKDLAITFDGSSLVSSYEYSSSDSDEVRRVLK